MSHREYADKSLSPQKQEVEEFQLPLLEDHTRNHNHCINQYVETDKPFFDLLDFAQFLHGVRRENDSEETGHLEVVRGKEPINHQVHGLIYS